AVAGGLESAVAAVAEAGGRATPLVLDLLDGERLAPVTEDAIAALGHVDVLLNNAIYVGPVGLARFLDTPPEELQKRIFGNVTAQLLVAQPVVRHMVGRGRGTVAFTTSAAGWVPPRQPPGEGG